MKLIHLTYRAQFRQPLGALNPMELVLTMPIDVEVFEAKGANWKLRRPDSIITYERLPPCVSATEAKKQAGAHFAEQLSDWQAWHNGGPLLPSQFVIRESGKAYLLEPEDFTHVQHPKGPADRTAAQAACGKTFAHRCFVNVNAGPQPTCHTCRAYLQSKSTP